QAGCRNYRCPKDCLADISAERALHAFRELADDLFPDASIKLSGEGKLRVWGVGNVLLGDDAVGCKVAELLSERGMPGVVVCGTTPENYVATLRKAPPDTLLIVDAAHMGLAPGECRRFSVGELDAVMDSSHGIPLSVLLGPFIDSIEIVVLGIQPSTPRLGAPLSEVVEEAALRVADLIPRNEWRNVESLSI
ncbi:MAG: hydrogenase maturation protease, partial [Synergistaceae bacterium]|nr:hydrogenase maturation protease [Synergistaceae bacterium]